MGFIYLFTNLTNNKKYVGQTINDDNSRYKNHIQSVKNEEANDAQSPLHRAIRKYGIDNFSYKILASNIDDVEILNQLEIYYIKELGTLVPNGYNIDLGGRNCSHPKAEETKYKLTWGQAKLTEQEIQELRIAYANKESPKKIYDEKYKDRLHYNAFLNVWSGRRYSHVYPELLEKGRHTKLTQERADRIREIYKTTKISYAKLATQFGVSKSTIADIIANRTWKSQ